MIYTNKAFIAFLLLMFCGTVSLLGKNKLKNPKPNILLINIDDLGWRDLGYMGSHYYETPNIDKLSSQGMIFTNAYAAAANCAPSRAALFSGMYSPRTGIYTVGNSDRGKSVNRKLIPTKNTKYLADSVLTVAEVLQQHGYRTLHAGKWHISHDPKNFGFDVNIAGAEYGHPPGGYFSPWHNRMLKDGPEGQYLTDRITSDAIDSLRKISNQPFFMNFAMYAVHSPWQGKPELVKKYKQKKGSYGQHNPEYAAMIQTMDTNVGKLISYLKKSSKFRSTFIIFTSDNGGVYRITRQWPLRAGKGSYYEGGIRVPMVVVWPGKVNAQTSTDQPVVNTDFFPTFLDVAGIPYPEGKTLDGHSIMPILKGKANADKRMPIFWHFPVYLQSAIKNKQTGDPCFRTRPGSSVRSGPWILQQYFEDDHLELYNLDLDIGERKNVVYLYPERTRELHQLLTQWQKKVDAPIPKKENPDFQSGGCPKNTILEWNK